MPTLQLLRHAEAAHAGTDRDRPLSGRGREQADRVGAWLRDHAGPPALVLCSAAARARETLAALGDLTAGAEVVVEEELYGAASDALLVRLWQIPDGTSPVLVVGHNPGLHDLTVHLTGGGLRGGLQPAGLVVLTVGGGWTDLQAGTARLVTRLP